MEINTLNSPPRIIGAPPPLKRRTDMECFLFFYPKKFGFIRRRITPEAPRSAIPTTTLMIIFFPHDGFPEAIIIPHTIININETIKITVTNILVRLDIKTGKA
jgi:hypothetical protein